MSEPMHARRAPGRKVLRRRSLWLPSALILGLLSFVLSLLYMGANNDPVGATHDLPIALVNADKGVTVGGKQINIGAQITSKVAHSPDLKDKVAWKQVSRSEAEEMLGKDKAYGALVIPENFSASVAALALPQQDPKRPTMQVLTNPASGSFGSGMAAEINQKVAHAASTELGKQLSQQAKQQAAQAEKKPSHHAQQQADHAVKAEQPSTAEQLLLADPVAVTVQEGHELGTHSGLGLSAFFYTLVLVLGGMLGANVIHTQLDALLGYAASDYGPFRRAKPAERISRTRHFAVACGLMAALSLVTSALTLVAAVKIVGIDASHLALLWIYGACATTAMGITALALLAVFGMPGQLLSMLVLIGFAIPSAGATIPLEALPDFYRFLAEFEPFRQVVDGVRSILYFGAQTEAGLGRGWTMIGVGFVVALLFGFGMTRFYDRKGLHRSPIEGLEPHPVPAG
ncbi:YhgE/Pip domain-containing protein [Streptomyces sannanensis]|uniref:YhgE/Pip domain-containing protein n=1 Tax=Streptomyces sannanensis TaxID=285536 RepID=A0ABP6SMF6_9ACTN